MVTMETILYRGRSNCFTAAFILSQSSHESAAHFLASYDLLANASRRTCDMMPLTLFGRNFDRGSKRYVFSQQGVGGRREAVLTETALLLLIKFLSCCEPHVPDRSSWVLEPGAVMITVGVSI